MFSTTEQITDTTGDQDLDSADLAADGDAVVIGSAANLTGSNADGSDEVFRDRNGFQQISSFGTGTELSPTRSPATTVTPWCGPPTSTPARTAT